MKELKNISLFQYVDIKVLEDLAAEGLLRQRIYGKGETIHSQHSLCTEMDVLLSGKLLAYSLSTKGTVKTVFSFETGSILGANLLFGLNHCYPMDIYCAADSEVISIDKIGVKKLLEVQSFVLPFVSHLSMNAQGMNEKIAIYTQGTLRDNLTAYLLKLAEQQRSDVITLPTTKKQLADYLGVQRPSLFRELKRMKDEGLIEIANRRIELKGLR